MLACANSQVDVVRLLLSKGADANVGNDDGSTALMAAAMKGKAAIVHLLLDAGADPNVSDKDGDTALKIAFKFRFADLVDVLLHANARLSEPEAMAAFLMAVQEGELAIAQLLMSDRPGLVNCRNKDGESPLLLAVEHQQAKMAKALLDAGANANAIDPEKETPLMAAACLLYTSDAADD